MGACCSEPINQSDKFSGDDFIPQDAKRSGVASMGKQNRSPVKITRLKLEKLS